MHQVPGQMLCTAEIDMADLITPDEVDIFLDNATWAIFSTIIRYLKPPQVQPFLDVACSLTSRLWLTGTKLIGECRQSLTNCGDQHENVKHIVYDYKVGDKVLLINEGILYKAEFAYGKEPWTITTVHTNGNIRNQRRTRMERLSIWSVQPFTDVIL
jgi:hypothetical protein